MGGDNDPLYAFLDLLTFVKNFKICVQVGCWSVISFSGVSLSGFGMY